MFLGLLVLLLPPNFLHSCIVRAHSRQEKLCLQLRQSLINLSGSIFCDLEEYGGLTFTDYNGDQVVGWDFGNRGCHRKTSTLLAVVRPRNALEVSEVVRMARRLGIPVSVRSGGHSYTCNSIKPGSVHLDMRSMNKIEIIENNLDDSPAEEERFLLRTGTGNTMKQLLKYTGEDFSFVHGECHSVGVGGFFLHGGAHAGILTEKYGFGNESIREIEMVTADGSFLHFREKRWRRDVRGYMDYHREPVEVTRNGELVTGREWSDLWDAMRVAGSSFGVVTTLTVQLFDAHEPHVFFFVIKMSDDDQFQLFTDAFEDDRVSLNLYNDATFQISLVEGSQDRARAQEECLQWLDDWMTAPPRQYYNWRTEKLQSVTTFLVNSWANLFGHHDYSTIYPMLGDWVTSSINLRSTDPERLAVMKWYKDKFQQANSGLGYCWLVLVQLGKD